MNNPWKLATIAMALVMVTALITGLTTAYVVRPAASAQAEPVPAGLTTPVRYAVAAPAAAPRPVVRPVAASPAPTDCATGGDRAWRIAKPGVIGGLVGAGVGAAGGAIANGGQAAGKGALIGGLAGAALGTGYGAYKTRQDCGTIFGGSGSGSGAGMTTPPLVTAGRGDDAQASLQSVGDAITVYRAR